MAQPERDVELPVELVDAIIDNLQDDRSTMATAGLIGKIWYERTRMHLLRRIRIDEKSDPHVRCADLNVVFKQRPYLASYVKALSLNLGELRYWSVERVRGGDFVELVGLLGCLREVEIKGGGALCLWSDLPSTVRETLYALLRRPTVTIVKLSSIHGLNVPVLAGCQQIDELTLHHVGSLVSPSHDFDAVRDAQIPRQAPTQLSSVSTHSTPSNRRFLDIQLDYAAIILSSSLKDAEVVPNFAHPTVLRIYPTAQAVGLKKLWERFLEQFGPTLEVLWIGGAAINISFVQNPAAFAHAPYLRHLGIEMSLESARVVLVRLTESALSLIGQFQKVLGRRKRGLVWEILVDPRREALRGMAYFASPRSPDALCRMLEELGVSPAWENLQALVQGSATPSGIGEVCVSMRVDDETSSLAGQPWTSFQEMVRGKMQVLEESGRLKFRID